MNDEEALEQIQHYIEIGAIRLAGYNEEGEAVFELNETVTKKLAPELWEAHMEYVDDNLLDLFESEAESKFQVAVVLVQRQKPIYKDAKENSEFIILM